MVHFGLVVRSEKARVNIAKNWSYSCSLAVQTDLYIEFEYTHVVTY